MQKRKNGVVEMVESDAERITNGEPRGKERAAVCQAVRTIGSDDEIRSKKPLPPEECLDAV